MKWFTCFLAAAIVGCTSTSATRETKWIDDPSMPLPLRIQLALQRLDDDFDILHSDITPSTETLISIGMPAIEPTLPCVLSENDFTRTHAFRVVTLIICHECGYAKGEWTDPVKKTEFERLMAPCWTTAEKRNHFTSETTHEERIAFVENVKQWMADRNQSHSQ